MFVSGKERSKSWIRKNVVPVKSEDRVRIAESLRTPITKGLNVEAARIEGRAETDANHKCNSFQESINSLNYLSNTSVPIYYCKLTCTVRGISYSRRYS
jgi:hypothetical protein